MAETGLLHPLQHIADQREMRAREDRKTDDVDALLDGGVDDLGRGQADALVDHFKAGVAGAHRDLLGTVGVAVEARLADQHLDPPAEPVRDRRHPRPHLGQGLAAGRRRRLADPGRRPELAEDFPQRPRPFAAGNPGVGAGDRGRHDVGAVLGRSREAGQRDFHRFTVARRPPSLEAGDLLGLGLGVDREKAAILAGR